VARARDIIASREAAKKLDQLCLLSQKLGGTGSGDR
jgi:hypothetical protein